MRAIVTVLLVAAAACHGGTTSSASGIHLNATTTTVFAGGPGVALTATVAGSNDSVAWSLEGPGALAQRTGSSTTYTPPPCLGQPASAKVTASAAGAAASVTFEIQSTSGAVCLSISPEDAEITIGDGGIQLTANTSGSLGDITWTLLGPGTFSSNTGSSTVYSPPEYLPGDQELSVTVTASASSGAVAHALVRINPRQMFQVGQYPTALAFDGANVWVYVRGNSTLIKLRASDGAVQGSYPFANGSVSAMLVEGETLWVASYGPGNFHDQLTKIRTTDGATIGYFSVGSTQTFSLAFDGNAVWFVDGNDYTVGRVRADDGQWLGATKLPVSPGGVAVAGSEIWVTTPLLQALTHIRSSDAANLGNIYVGGPATDAQADGAGGLWILVQGSTTRIVHMDATTGTVVDSVPLTDHPYKAVVAGDSLWTYDATRFTKRRLPDLQVQRTAVVFNASAAVYDGVHLWVASYGGGYLTRL